MVRSTTSSAALILMVTFAGPGLAADTGMLYVKSFPAGATVVIKGKERGKTPVLVRDLPAGDITVELRIAGVKPVTKQATVRANKVVTIDVAIEVPSATLTIVSEPLEATVILDGREVGKTPLTLEHLEPGEHSLILLKDGHPRTARSVVLESGGERVLEVKLGTAGGDDTPRPAPGKEAAKAAKSVPVEVQLIFTMLKETVAKGNYSETRRNLALALSQPDMANFKEELRAAIRVVQALEVRQRQVRKGAEALVGKEVTLRTKTGPRSGKVEGVSFEGIAFASKIMVEGVAAGETRGVIKWAALAPEEQGRLAASWKPEGADGAVALAILAQARRDKAAAARALAAAGEHALGKYLGGGSAAAGPAEEDPMKIWARIEKKYRVRRVTAAEETALDKEIRAFRRKYGARIDSSLRRRMSLAAARAKRASGLVGHWTFDEGGGSVARDWSGRGKHGRIQGGARWVKGKIGAALSFDGTGHVATNLPGILGGQPRTVSLWARTAEGRSNICALSYGAPDSGMGKAFRCCFNWDGVEGAAIDVNHGLVLRRADVGDNTWHHYTWVLPNAVDPRLRDVRVYRDGQLLTAIAFVFREDRAIDTARGRAVHIGQYLDRQYFVGDLDDVRIYSRALSAEEVKALAAAAE